MEQGAGSGGDSDRRDQIAVGSDRELAGDGTAIVELRALQHPRRWQSESRSAAGADDARSDCDSECAVRELSRYLSSDHLAIFPRGGQQKRATLSRSTR
jgi:hypothetical protein